jgi:hypothetical protein
VNLLTCVCENVILCCEFVILCYCDATASDLCLIVCSG